MTLRVASGENLPDVATVDRVRIGTKIIDPMLSSKELIMDTVPLGGGYTVIHLTYLPAGSSEWRIACMSGITNFATAAHQPNYLRSNDTRAVTCLHCKKMPVFDKVKATER